MIKKILLSLLFYSRFCYAVEEFDFKKSLSYTIMYLTTTYEIVVEEGMYFQKQWNIQVECKDIVEKSPAYILEIKRTEKQYKIFIEFLHVEEDGTRTLELIPIEKIINISLVTKSKNIEKIPDIASNSNITDGEFVLNE